MLYAVSLNTKTLEDGKIMDNKQKGYSLAELMIVVSIIGILGIIAVPNFVTSVSTYKLKNSSVDLCSNLRKARSIAVKQNRTVAINFNIDAKTYSIDNGSSVRLEEGIYFGHGNATASANPIESIPSDGVSFASEKATINNQGISNAGYVYLQNGKGETYAVGMHASGRIVLRHWVDGRWN
jgi:prepilin-type N-terminal cleavage/methylation domain-containing protein